VRLDRQWLDKRSEASSELLEDGRRELGEVAELFAAHADHRSAAIDRQQPAGQFALSNHYGLRSPGSSVLRPSDQAHFPALELRPNLAPSS
jgi:hypothetical protein